MTRLAIGARLLASAAGAAAIVALPARALACGGECAAQAGPFLGTLIVAAVAVWVVARVAAWLRGRLQARRPAHGTLGDPHEEAR